MNNRKQLKTEVITADNRRVLVSTVELYTPSDFETMVFGVDDDGKIDYTDLACRRYKTWDQATTGHSEMVEKWTTQGSDAHEEVKHYPDFGGPLRQPRED